MTKVHISPIKEMEIRASQLEGVVSLAQGIPSFDTPDCIKRKAIEAIQEGKVARYSLSPGMLELREAIEYSLSKDNIFYDFENEIIVTAGSIEAISATFLALLEPGDEVLIPDPTYTSYQSAIKTARGIPVFVPLNEKRGWAFDIDEFKKRITPKTKAILFCNPNNPTGTIYDRNQLIQLGELAKIHNLYILSDEVYKDFIYDERDFYTLAQFPSFRDRVIYIFSFSKAYAMTGWRVAFLATDKELAKKIVGAHDALVTCAPVVSQWGALAALEMAGEDVKKFREIFKERRTVICQKLDTLSKWLEYAHPSSAYFTFPKFKKVFKEKLKAYLEKNPPACFGELRRQQKESLSWLFSLKLLEEEKVVVVPGVAFGPEGEDHFRLCFGRKKINIEKGLNRIGEFIRKVEESRS